MRYGEGFTTQVFQNTSDAGRGPRAAYVVQSSTVQTPCTPRHSLVQSGLDYLVRTIQVYTVRHRSIAAPAPGLSFPRYSHAVHCLVGQGPPRGYIQPSCIHGACEFRCCAMVYCVGMVHASSGVVRRYCVVLVWEKSPNWRTVEVALCDARASLLQ